MTPFHADSFARSLVGDVSCEMSVSLTPCLGKKDGGGSEVYDAMTMKPKIYSPIPDLRFGN